MSVHGWTPADERAFANAERAWLEPPDEPEGDEDGEVVCRNPGRYGCGRCVGCEAWADREIDWMGDDREEPLSWDSL